MLQAIVYLVVLVIGVFAWLHYRLPKAAAEDAARHSRMFESAGISGEVEWVVERKAFVFEHAGRSYMLRYAGEGPSFAAGDGLVDASTAWACLETSVNSKGTFSLHRKGAVQRFMGTAGLSKSISSGDPRFDDHFMIVSDTPDIASEYFSDDERRRAARALFGLGYTGISVRGGMISLCWIPFSNGSSGEDGPFLRAGLESMKILAGNPNA